MKESSLPRAGVGANEMHLRRIAAKAISHLEMVADKYTNGVHPSSASLVAFFNACAAAAAIPGLLKSPLVITTAGGVTTFSHTTTLAAGNTHGSANGTVTYTSSDPSVATVNASTGLITGVKAGQVTITANITQTSTYRAAQSSVVLTLT